MAVPSHGPASTGLPSRATPAAARRYRPAMPLSLENAQTVIAGAHERARELGIAVSVAVVDESGLLVALARMDGAPPISPEIAEAKACGCALWRREGDSLEAVYQDRPGFFAQVDRMARRPLMPGKGSLLVRRSADVLGAIGVSGGTPDQDVDCGRAGLALLEPS